MARRRGITQDDVVDAAAAIADADGLAAVTLAAVAARLGIRAPSLYAHVDGLPGLRRLLALRAAHRMSDALRRTARAKTGTDALRALLHEYRRFATRWPGLYAAAQHAVVPGEDDELYGALAAVIEPVLRALTEAGVAQADLIHTTRAMRSALHGFVDLERRGGFGMPESIDESYDRLVELLLVGLRGQAA